MTKTYRGRASRTCAILFGNPCSGRDGSTCDEHLFHAMSYSKEGKRWLRHHLSSKMGFSPTCGTGNPLRSWWILPVGLPGWRLPPISPFAVSNATSPHAKNVQAIVAGNYTDEPITR